MIRFRAFTKNDWMGYMGAESFNETTPPNIADIVVVGIAGVPGEISGDVIHDALSVCVYLVVGNTALSYQRIVEPGEECNAVLSLLQSRMTEAQLLALAFEKQEC